MDLIKLLEINKAREKKESAKEALLKDVEEQRKTKEELALPPLWKHQRDAIIRSKNLDYFGFFFEVGCLASDTKIKTNRNGISRSYTIEDLYRRFNNVESPQNPWKKDAPTFIRAWNGKHIGLHKIRSVIRSGEKEVYELTTALTSYRVKATKDHEILTKRGFIQLQNIVPGKDYVAIDTLKRHQKKKVKKQRVKPRYLRNRVGKFHPYARKMKAQMKNGYIDKPHRIVDTHRLVYEASINGLAVEDFIEKTYEKNKLKFINPKKYHVHHLNGNTYDNRLDNLQCLEAREHLRIHGNYSNFGHGYVGYVKVKKITRIGVEMTYDISCEDPHRNFVANGIVVHNCGKSRALCGAIDEKNKIHGRTLKTIVFCPLVVVENLEREFKRFSKIPHDKIIPLSGPLKDRLKKIERAQGGNVVFITNYEAVYSKPFVDMLKSWPVEVIICDELHKIKDQKSKRTKVMIELSKAAKYRFGLSGTPILNSQLDLFTQIYFLDHGKALGKNYFVFRSKYFYDANASRKGTHNYFPNWVPREGINKELQELITPFTSRVLKKDALDLPPLLKKEVYCEMGDEQRKAYNQMRDDFIAFLNDKACVAELALTKALRLQQIVSGFIKIGDETQSVEAIFKEVPRLNALRQILEDITPNKVIIWAVFKKNYEMIANICSELKIKYSMLHGETPDKQKQIDDFQNDPEVKVMIANPGAGGIGINLTAASYMVYYSKSFSLEHELQSEARAHRGGSEIHEKITRIDIVSRETIDEIITKVLAKKKEIGDSVLDSKEILRMLKKV